MNYYYAGLEYSADAFQHHGIKGQRWGVRRFQYLDGTLTPAGKARYGEHIEDVSDRKLKNQIKRKEYNSYQRDSFNNVIKADKQIKKENYKKFDSMYWASSDGQKRVDSIMSKYAEAFLKDMGYKADSRQIEYLKNKEWFNVPYSEYKSGRDPYAKNRRPHYT